MDMAMEVKRTTEGSETWNTDGTLKECEIKYLVLNPTAKKAAIDAVIAASPSSYEGKSRQSIRFDGYSGDGCIEISVTYADESSSQEASDEEEDKTNFNFDCSTTTKHVNYTKKPARLVHYAKGYNKDAGCAVGWNGKPGDKSEISGVDLPVGQLKETYERIMSLSKLTTDFKRKLCALVGKVNSTAFNGWEPGEVMFMGAAYAAPDEDATKVKVVFNFSIQPNEADAKVNGISCGKKKGFEPIWAVTHSETDTTTGKTSLLVDAVYISEACEEADFSFLGLNSASKKRLADFAKKHGTGFTDFTNKLPR